MIFPAHPVRNVGYRLMVWSTVIHGAGVLGWIGGTPRRHVMGWAFTVLWSLWMMYGGSKTAWALNVLGTALAAIGGVVVGLGLLPGSPVQAGLLLAVGGIMADLCRRLYRPEVRRFFE